jgi:hypothetical protein
MNQRRNRGPSLEWRTFLKRYETEHMITVPASLK